MKKLVLLGLTLITVLPLFCQDLVWGRAEINTGDKRLYHANVTGSTMTTIGNLHIDSASYKFFVGPNLAKKTDDAVRTGLLLGFGYIDKKILCGLEIYFKVTEIQNFEIFVFAQLMKDFKRSEAMVTFKGEFLYRFSKRLQFGIDMRAEQKKWKSATPYGSDGLRYDDNFSLSGRGVWTPKNSDHFAVIGSIGFAYRNQSSKTLINGLVWDTSPKDGIKNNFNASFGLQYRLKYY